MGNLQASPFRALLGAHMKYGQQALAFTLADSRGRSARIVLPYDSWTHPLGCLGPYAGMSWTYRAQAVQRSTLRCLCVVQRP